MPNHDSLLREVAKRTKLVYENFSKLFSVKPEHKQIVERRIAQKLLSEAWEKKYSIPIDFSNLLPFEKALIDGMIVSIPRVDQRPLTIGAWKCFHLREPGKVANCLYVLDAKTGKPLVPQSQPIGRIQKFGPLVDDYRIWFEIDLAPKIRDIIENVSEEDISFFPRRSFAFDTYEKQPTHFSNQIRSYKFDENKLPKKPKLTNDWNYDLIHDKNASEVEDNLEEIASPEEYELAYAQKDIQDQESFVERKYLTNATFLQENDSMYNARGGKPSPRQVMQIAPLRKATISKAIGAGGFGQVYLLNDHTILKLFEERFPGEGRMYQELANELHSANPNRSGTTMIYDVGTYQKSPNDNRQFYWVQMSKIIPLPAYLAERFPGKGRSVGGLISKLVLALVHEKPNFFVAKEISKKLEELGISHDLIMSAAKAAFVLRDRLLKAGANVLGADESPVGNRDKIDLDIKASNIGIEAFSRDPKIVIFDF